VPQCNWTIHRIGTYECLLSSNLVSNKNGVEGISCFLYIFVYKVNYFYSFLLKTLPEVIRNSKDIPLRKFDEKRIHNIVECLREMRKKFFGERNALNWNE